MYGARSFFGGATINKVSGLLRANRSPQIIFLLYFPVWRLVFDTRVFFVEETGFEGTPSSKSCQKEDKKTLPMGLMGPNGPVAPMGAHGANRN